MMIEIEKKYLVDGQKINKIIQGAEFIGQKKLVDIYYDTLDFRLTTKDWWLRNRNGGFELKMAVLEPGKKSSVDRYREVEDKREICRLLEIDDQIPFEKSLTNNGIEPFAKIIAERKKYQKGEFTLDFDITDFGYSICEIELMVEDETKINEASIKIENFGKENNFSDKPVRGKLVEYIFRNRFEHYQALRVAGIIRD